MGSARRAWRSPEEGSRSAGARPTDSSATSSGAVRADEGFWVAVLPFKYGGTDSSLTALAEGLTEEIVTGLSRFSYLQGDRAQLDFALRQRVGGRAFRWQGTRRALRDGRQSCDRRERGCASRCSSWTRVSGAHLWAESYERTFSPEAVFELQDDLVPRIVSTVADMHGVLPRSMSEAAAQPHSRGVEPLRGRAAQLRLLRSGSPPKSLPRRAPAWNWRCGRRRPMPMPGRCWRWLCVQDYAQGFNLQADSLASGLTAARRAVEAAPSNHLAHFSLAQALFFRKEFQGFRNAAERAVALNPMDGNSIAFLGELLTYAGDWERGLALAERAKQLNPNHPGWYWYADFYDAYRRGDVPRRTRCSRSRSICRATGVSHAATGRRLRAAR